MAARDDEGKKMHWIAISQCDDTGMVTVIGARVMPRHDDSPYYCEFAGRARTIAEAKNKALAVMWRQLRESRGLPQDEDMA